MCIIIIIIIISSSSSSSNSSSVDGGGGGEGSRINNVIRDCFRCYSALIKIFMCPIV